MALSGETLLPPASILEKLKAHDRDAPEEIISMAEDIGERRRAEEKKLTFSFINACRRGLKNFELAMIVYPGPCNPVPPSPEAQRLYESALRRRDEETMKEDWALTGDALRLAIGAYMTRHGLSTEKIGLDESEKDSLNLLLPERALGPERSGFFTRLRPA